MARITGRVALQTLRARLATLQHPHVGTADVHWSGRSLLIVRVAWLAVAAFTSALYLTSALMWLGELPRMCPIQFCQRGQLSVAVQRSLGDLHVSISVLNGYTLAWNVIFTLGYASIATLIFWRRSHDPWALFVSLALMLFGSFSFGSELLPLLNAYPVWQMPVQLLGFAGTAMFGVFLYVFPDGRFVPRWTILAVVAWVLWFLPNVLFPRSMFDFDMWPGIAFFGGWALFLASFLCAQGYRFRYISTPAQRLQTKWVVFGLVVASVGYFGGQLILFSGRALGSASDVLAYLIGSTTIYAALLVIPICIAIAMLRHHLFDVDLLIKQTLVYAVLVAVLALLYQVGALVLVKVVLAITGQESLVAEVAAAFGVGALAEPLHRRIERIITRVFNQRRYEAERRIEAFSRRLRHEWKIVPVTEEWEEAAENWMSHTWTTLWRRHLPKSAHTREFVQEPLFPEHSTQKPDAVWKTR